jgi:hypothetical protein
MGMHQHTQLVTLFFIPLAKVLQRSESKNTFPYWQVIGFSKSLMKCSIDLHPSVMNASKKFY